jgi:hypothetical protein
MLLITLVSMEKECESRIIFAAGQDSTEGVSEGKSFESAIQYLRLTILDPKNTKLMFKSRILTDRRFSPTSCFCSAYPVKIDEKYHKNTCQTG